MEFNLLLNQCLPHVLYDQEIKYNVYYGYIWYNRSDSL